MIDWYWHSIVAWIIAIAIGLPMFIAAVSVIDVILDGWEQRDTAQTRCQKRATTPYEYHQCR